MTSAPGRGAETSTAIPCFMLARPAFTGQLARSHFSPAITLWASVLAPDPTNRSTLPLLQRTRGSGLSHGPITCLMSSSRSEEVRRLCGPLVFDAGSRLQSELTVYGWSPQEIIGYLTDTNSTRGGDR